MRSDFRAELGSTLIPHTTSFSIDFFLNVLSPYFNVGLVLKSTLCKMLKTHKLTHQIISNVCYLKHQKSPIVGVLRGLWSLVGSLNSPCKIPLTVLAASVILMILVF